MIHLVTALNRAMYSQQLDEMHVQRKQAFIDELGWSAPQVRDGREFDEYDDDDAVYLLSLGAEGQVQASMRMRPTIKGCMIVDHFPHLIAPGEPSPIAPHIWEGSRILAAPGFRENEGRMVRAEIRIAAIELGLMKGFSKLIGMCDVLLLPTWRNNGWRSRILGPPAPYAEGEAFAFISEVSHDALAYICSKYNVTKQTAFELPAFDPPGDIGPHEWAEFVEVAAKLTPQQVQRAIGAIKSLVAQSGAASLGAEVSVLQGPPERA